MNTVMVRRIMFKEWYFQRWVVLGEFLAGMVAVAILCLGTGGSFYAGSVLLITVMIGVGVQLALTAGVNERTEQTLPFLMTLPVTPLEFAMAKVTANAAMFIVPWLFLSSSTMGLFWMSIQGRGLIPFSLIVLSELLASFCLVLGVAIVTESQGWTIGVMVVTNLFLQGFLYYVSHLPAIAAGMGGTVAVWNATAIGLLAVELGLSVLFLVTAFALQSRKRTFI